MSATASPINPGRMERSTDDNPCPDSSPESTTEVYLPLEEELPNPIAAARVLKRHCQTAKEAFISAGLLTRSEVANLESRKFILPGLPSISVDITASVNVEQLLTKDFNDSSVSLVFINHSLPDYSGLDIKVTFIEVEKSFSALQTSIQNTLRSLGTNITATADVSIIPDALKKLDNAKLRFKRDYLLIKHSDKFASAISDKYDAVRKCLL